MTKALDYIEKELGFQKIDVDFDAVTIGEGSGEDYIFINFKRGIVFKWASGYDPCCLIGSLTKKEESRIWQLDKAEYHIGVENDRNQKNRI